MRPLRARRPERRCTSATRPGFPVPVRTSPRSHPTAAQKDRAGWGYLLLSLFLPNLGNGTFTLYAYADDGDGHSTLLGTKTITCANCDSVTPFGAIDTPGQGKSSAVSSTTSAGCWRQGRPTTGRRADPTGGGTVRVVIDGVRSEARPVGPLGDLTSSFPDALQRHQPTLGVFTFDSRTLTNGIHTIAWAVTDNMGGTRRRQPVFTVANASASTAASTAASAASESVAMAAVAPVVTPLVGRHGYDLDAPWRNYRANSAGVVVVQSEELDRIELYTQATSGSLVTANGLRHLPIGASLDARRIHVAAGCRFRGLLRLPVHRARR